MVKFSRTVVVVNDTGKSGDKYKQQLKQDASFFDRVVTELYRLESFSWCNSQQVDAILIDLHHPEHNPLDFLRQLNRELGGNCPPVVIVGSNDAEIAVQALKNGAADYLVKDRMTADKLRLAMRNAIENAKLKRLHYSQQQSHYKEKETALQPTQEGYQTLAEAMPQMVWTANAEGDVNYWNQRWYDYTGLSEAESMGKAAVNVIHEDNRDRVLEKWSQSITHGDSFEIEYRLRCRDGVYHWFICRGIPLRDAQEEITGWIGTITDIDQIKHKHSEAAIRLSEQQVRRVLDSLFSFVGVMTPDGVLIEANQTALDAASLSSNDVLGKPFVEAYWWSYSPEIQAQLEDAIAQSAQGEIVRYDVQVRLNDDHFITLDFALVPLLDETGEVEYLIPSGIDITDRIQAEISLQENEAKLQRQLAEIEAIYQTAPIGLCIFDRDLRFRKINERLAEINGLPVKAHIGHTVSELLPALGDTVEQLLFPLLETGEPLLNVDVQGETPAQPGVKRTWLTNFIPLKDGDSVIGISAVCEEITERKQAEAALRESQDRLRLAIDSAKLGSWDWDIITNQLTWDLGCKAIFGVPADAEVTFDTFFGILHPEDRDRIEQIIQASINSANNGKDDMDDVTYLEYRIIKMENGVECWIAAKGQVYFDDNRNPLRFIGMVLDITEQKQNQTIREQLLKREQAAREEAERANRLKDEFLAVISHELRTPLNPILGWTKLLQSRAFSPARTATALATIEKNARLQSRLVDDLLDIAQILRGKLSLNFKPTNLVNVINNAIDTVSIEAEEKHISLGADLDKIGQVSGDQVRLQQIFWNLLSNAIKFTPNGGRIEICLTQVGDQAQVIVTDTGRGISAEFLPQIFESFRQQDGSITRQFGGLGLGLAIVGDLVKAHGGEITADSPGEGQGATFRVLFPLLESIA